MQKRRYRVEEDSVTEEGRGAPELAGKPGRPRGEDETEHGSEPGRTEAAPEGPTRRPRGQSSARDTTSIDPQDPIDPDSPNLR